MPRFRSIPFDARTRTGGQTMFETSVVHAAVVNERRVGLLSVSFAGHILIVISILAAGIRTIELPRLPPREYLIPVFSLPISIPPALRTPNAGHQQATPPPPVKHYPLC